jgi:hypothetical protein
MISPENAAAYINAAPRCQRHGCLRLATRLTAAAREGVTLESWCDEHATGGADLPMAEAARAINAEAGW